MRGIRCHHYDDDGNATNGPCPGQGDSCDFVHPSDSGWRSAHTNLKRRSGGGATRGSGTRGRDDRRGGGRNDNQRLSWNQSGNGSGGNKVGWSSAQAPTRPLGAGTGWVGSGGQGNNGNVDTSGGQGWGESREGWGIACGGWSGDNVLGDGAIVNPTDAPAATGNAWGGLGDNSRNNGPKQDSGRGGDDTTKEVDRNIGMHGDARNVPREMIPDAGTDRDSDNRRGLPEKRMDNEGGGRGSLANRPQDSGYRGRERDRSTHDQRPSNSRDLGHLRGGEWRDTERDSRDRGLEQNRFEFPRVEGHDQRFEVSEGLPNAIEQSRECENFSSRMDGHQDSARQQDMSLHDAHVPSSVVPQWRASGAERGRERKEFGSGTDDQQYRPMHDVYDQRYVTPQGREMAITERGEKPKEFDYGNDAGIQPWREGVECARTQNRPSEHAQQGQGSRRPRMSTEKFFRCFADATRAYAELEDAKRELAWWTQNYPKDERIGLAGQKILYSKRKELTNKVRERRAEFDHLTESVTDFPDLFVEVPTDLDDMRKEVERLRADMDALHPVLQRQEITQQQEPSQSTASPRLEEGEVQENGNGSRKRKRSASIEQNCMYREGWFSEKRLDALQERLERLEAEHFLQNSTSLWDHESRDVLQRPPGEESSDEENTIGGQTNATASGRLQRTQRRLNKMENGLQHEADAVGLLMKDIRALQLQGESIQSKIQEVLASHGQLEATMSVVQQQLHSTSQEVGQMSPLVQHILATRPLLMPSTTEELFTRLAPMVLDAARAELLPVVREMREASENAIRQQTEELRAKVWTRIEPTVKLTTSVHAWLRSAKIE